MKCPGQDTKYWKDDAIFEVKCPECRAMVEFYKDDTTRKCHKCSHRFVNPKMDFGCATYCQFAEECLGTLPEEFVMQQDNLLKDKVAVEVKRYFKNDFKRISQATKTARYAEKLGKQTDGANLALILCSAYLLHVGYVEASKKKNSEVEENEIRLENPAIATEIMQRLKAPAGLIHQVCEIIGKQQANAGVHNSPDYQIVNDASLLTVLEGGLKNENQNEQEIKMLLDSFLSENGRNEALKIIEALSTT